VDLVRPVKDRVRTLLRIRVSRGLPSVGAKPALGARLYLDDVRMTVQAGMTDALWRWLVREGWREITFRPDRRRYRDVTAAYVTRLIDSSSNEERERVLAAAVASATLRPLPARRGALTNTRGRP
jgi:hypothetical protein